MNEEKITLESSRAQSPRARGFRNPIVETIVAALAVFAILIVLSLTRAANKPVENSWIVIAVLPVLFWLFFSGRISSFKGFGVELQSAIRRAADETVRTDDKELGTIDYEGIVKDEKTDVTLIQKYIDRRVTALYFELGKKGYYEPKAIKMWLDGLGEHAFFKWVVFQDKCDRFKGLIAVEKIRIFASLKMPPPNGYEMIKTMIEKGDVSDLPGVIGPDPDSDHAIEKTSTKRNAIKQFSKTDAEYLPVLDQGKFEGVLNRGKLHSSVLESIIRAADTN